MFNFLSPLLFWGMLLAIVPLIIHLMNRRRYRRVQWAPMRHLRMTIRRNRRRIQIEQLLLLLLRMALPILLFFFLARPVVNPTGLEKWFIGAGRSSQVILLDDSLSMGYTPAGPSAFQRAREVAGAVLAAAQPQDRCTLVATSAPKTPIFHEAEGADREVAGPRRPDRADHRDAYRLAHRVRRDRRGGPVVHLPNPRAHDRHRPPQGRLGLRALARLPGAGPSKGFGFAMVDVGADEVTNVALEDAHPARPDDPRRG